MPTYKYRREDDTTFTLRQKITADALEECPDTGQCVERVITGGAGFHLKGGGWYKDGYASPNASKESPEGKESSDGESKNGDNKTSGEAASSNDGNANGSSAKTSETKKSSATGKDAS